MSVGLAGLLTVIGLKVRLAADESGDIEAQVDRAGTYAERMSDVTVGSYYRTVISRAANDARGLIGEHVRFSLLLLPASYVVGVIAGTAVSAKTVLTLVVYPVLALCLVVLFVVATKLIVAPVRLAREATAEPDQLREQHAIAEIGPEPSPLERWLNARLAAADILARQRAARGDRWYFDAMSDWDTTNVKRMAFGEGARDALAPELVEGYREEPRTGQADGIYPPQDAAEYDRYYEQRKAWIRATIEALRTGTIEPPEPAPEIPEKHREELQAIADGLDNRLTLERRSVYAPRSGSGTQPVAQSFRAHFPKLTGTLDERDQLVDELEQAREAMQSWVGENSSASLLGPLTWAIQHVVERGGDALPWVETDYLMLGPAFAMIKITDDVDLDAFKRPYDEMLEAARDSDEGATLRRARLRLDAANATLHTELERIKAFHVIRGRCDLCV
jgi:hypothetical protein